MNNAIENETQALDIDFDDLYKGFEETNRLNDEIAQLIYSNFQVWNDRTAKAWWSYKENRKCISQPKDDNSTPYTIPYIKSNLLADIDTGLGGQLILSDNMLRNINIDIDNHGGERNPADVLDDFKAVHNLLSDNDIIPLLSKSSSGTGYHLWIILDKNYPVADVFPFVYYLKHQIDSLKIEAEVKPEKDSREETQAGVMLLPLSLRSYLIDYNGSKIDTLQGLKAIEPVTIDTLKQTAISWGYDETKPFEYHEISNCNKKDSKDSKSKKSREKKTVELDPEVTWEPWTHSNADIMDHLRKVLPISYYLARFNNIHLSVETKYDCLWHQPINNPLQFIIFDGDETCKCLSTNCVLNEGGDVIRFICMDNCFNYDDPKERVTKVTDWAIKQGILRFPENLEDWGKGNDSAEKLIEVLAEELKNNPEPEEQEAEELEPEPELEEKPVAIKDVFDKNSIGRALYDVFEAKDITGYPAIFGTLLAIGGKMGNRFYLNNGLGDVLPNLFVMLVGPTGSGKDKVLDTIKGMHQKPYYHRTRQVSKVDNRYELIKTDVMKTYTIFPEKMSQSYLYEQLFFDNYGMVLISEYSKHIGRRIDDPDNIEELILQTYNAHKNWRFAGRVSKKLLSNESIKFPAPTLCCGIQPDLYMKYANDRIENGLLARFVHVKMNKKKAGRISEIINNLQANNISEKLAGDMLEYTIGNAFTEETISYLETVRCIDKNSDYNKQIEIDPLAIDIYDEWRLGKIEMMSDADDLLIEQSNKIMGELPFKLSLILAMGNEPDNQEIKVLPVITGEIMRRALFLCDYCINTLDWVLGTGRNINANEQSVLMFLKNHPKKEFTVSQMKTGSRKIRRLPDNQIYEILYKAERIGQVIKSTGKKYRYNV